MALQLLHQAPIESDFTPLSEHQSHTPATFFSGPAVLHYRAQNASLLLSTSDLEILPSFAPSPASTAVNGTAAEGDEEQDVVIPSIDVWVTSENLILASASTAKALEIPYPSISVHAIQRLRLPAPADQEEQQGLYMQIQTSSAEEIEHTNEEDAGHEVFMTVIPASTRSTAASESAAPTAAEPKDDDQSSAVGETSTTATQTQSTPTLSPVQALFDAVTACANLHPDPGMMGADDDEEDGTGGEGIPGVISMGGDSSGLPPALPGSGGWITAENMHEFFDEEGNWIGGGSGGGLGPGAGTIRTRDEGDEERVNGVDGEAHEDGHEARWRRTS